MNHEFNYHDKTVLSNKPKEARLTVLRKTMIHHLSIESLNNFWRLAIFKNKVFS